MMSKNLASLSFFEDWKLSRALRHVPVSPFSPTNPNPSIATLYKAIEALENEVAKKPNEWAGLSGSHKMRWNKGSEPTHYEGG